MTGDDPEIRRGSRSHAIDEGRGRMYGGSEPAVVGSAHEILGAAAVGLGTSVDLAETLEIIADSAKRALGAERATCYANDVDAQVVSAVYTTEEDPKRRAFLQHAVGRGCAELPIWGLQLAHLDPLLVVEDVTSNPIISPALAARLGSGAFLGVRLEHRSVRADDAPALLGALFLSYAGPRRFSASEQQAARGLANLAALAMANARLHAEAMATAAQNEVLAAEQAALRRVATAVASDEPQEVFSLVGEEVAKLLDADGGAVVRFEGGTLGVLIGSWAAEDVPLRLLGVGLPLSGDSASARVFRTGRAARMENYRMLDEPTAQVMGPIPYRSGVAAPIRVGSQLWGAVAAVTRSPVPFPPGSEERLVQFAALVAVAIANAEARAELATQAATDPLTALPNRRTLEACLERAVEQARRTGRPLSLLVLDLDGFKEINDSQGHDAGDGVLRVTARTLEAALRPGDLAGRLGGEEFLALLPDTSSRAAWLVAERLRAAITAQTVEGVPNVTVSVGVASFPGHGVSSGELLRAADSAMYDAKALGRDRTMVFSPSQAAIRTERTERAQAGLEGYVGSVLALAVAVDARDPSTHQHSQAVAGYAAAIAVQLGLDGDRVEEVRIAGLLHDVGKVGVPDAVLQKPGALTDEEWVQIRRHPEIGARLLVHPELSSIREWVLRHHEQPDGSGYPDGLVGSQIPIEAKILAVADAYEAMIADRPYRQGLSPLIARTELEEGRGRQFDADVVAAFLAFLSGGDDATVLAVADSTIS